MASCAPTPYWKDARRLKKTIWPSSNTSYGRLPTSRPRSASFAPGSAIPSMARRPNSQSSDTQQKVVVVAEGIDKLKAIHAGLVQLQEQAAAKGRATGKIEKSIASVQEMREKVGALILGAM